MAELKIQSAKDYRPPRSRTLDEKTLAEAQTLIDRVRQGGASELQAIAERFGDRQKGDALLLSPAELRQSLQQISSADRAVLERSAHRIEQFAKAQRESIREIEIQSGDLRIGHEIAPMQDRKSVV